MNKIVKVICLSALLALTGSSVLAAGSWAEKVTGGGQATASGIDFSITISTKLDLNDIASGQMEYWRAGQSVADLSLHATVQCVGVFQDGTVAVAAGPARVQYDPAGLIGEDAWMVVEILEDGTGSGDKVRVRVKPLTEALAICETPSFQFPGTIYDGNFNIRSSD